MVEARVRGEGAMTRPREATRCFGALAKQEDRGPPSLRWFDPRVAIATRVLKTCPISWRQYVRKLFAVMVSAALLLSLTAGAATAKRGPTPQDRLGSDNRPGVLAKRQNALKQKALEMVLAGEAKAKGKNKVVKVADGGKGNGDGIFVELDFEGEDQILTLLGEFGDEPATHDHGAPPNGFGVIDHMGDPGPRHNQIPQPNRLGVDNTTIWVPDFSQAYYDRLLYDKGAKPSMANWYLEQSSGTYSVDGYVSDWVQVPHNAAAYGSNYCGSIVCTRDVGRFVEDQADTWWDVLVAQEGSVAAANFFLSRFDIWDRYDWDLDGDFDEPDGYIDHFQSVHAGEGEETGGGAYGEDAIWSHRAYVNSIPVGADGPAGFAPFGGARIGASAYWIGDYTIEPENGGVGVFAHEFGHDLGLPDLYDTSGNTGFAENSTAWWTIMSQGSYGTVGRDIGSYPTHFGAWEKLQLGFLNYDVALAGVNKQRFTLGPAEKNSIAAQALVVQLPPKVVVTNVGTPFEGSWFYNSDNGNDLDNTMTRQVTLPASSGAVEASFMARYHIEPCWDYAYLQISTDGTTFENVHTSASDHPDANVNGQNFGEGISGISGTPLACDDDLSPTPEWVEVTADLSEWAGQSVWLRFRYWTDGAVVGEGISIDNLSITGSPVDGAETDPGWEYDGWFRTDGTVTSEFAHFYIAEYRTYMGYDRALKRGPYSFVSDENWVEHFPYQDGLLIWYWDTSQADNNVSEHPGEGLILPIDSHPKTFNWSNGDVARPRLQGYDSPFTLERTDDITLHRPGLGGVLDIGSKKGKSVFNDNKTYWRSSDPGDGDYMASWNSVRNPHTGTTIRILRIYHNDKLMDVRVN
jgi:immune inhibitor A